MRRSFARAALIGSALGLASIAQAGVGLALDIGQASVSGPASDFVGGIEGDGATYGVRFVYGAEHVDFELGYRRLPEAIGQLQIACPGGCGPLPPVQVDPLYAWSFAVALRPFASVDRLSIVAGVAMLDGGTDGGGTEGMFGLRYTVLRRQSFELALTAETMRSADVIGLAFAFGR